MCALWDIESRDELNSLVYRVTSDSTHKVTTDMVTPYRVTNDSIVNEFN